MKKTLLIFSSVMLAAVTASAQLKVDLDGNTHMGNAIEDDHAILNVGSSPYDTENDYEWGYRLGIHGERYNTTGNKDVIGVFGEAYQTNVQNAWSTYGVWGFSRNYGGRCYGVMGSIVSGYGVGVFGTDEYSPRYYVPGYYAGYFQGTTYVDGDFTATAIYNPSDMRLKHNVVSLSDMKDGRGAALSNLMGLDVIEYNLQIPREELPDRKANPMADEGRARYEERKKAEEAKKHYGLSAQELQKVYPDLVQEGQDGYLAVNYTELVPILIRSIQELKAELDDLKGNADEAQQTEPVRRARQATTTSIGDDVAGTATQATLYQNSPNPFTSQTVIRFSLPDNAQNAYIYIFDMQGKMVKQLPVNASMQSVTINGYELQAGIYLYSLVVGGQEIDTKRMILSK
jgi:hypothetical protein